MYNSNKIGIITLICLVAFIITGCGIPTATIRYKTESVLTIDGDRTKTLDLNGVKFTISPTNANSIERNVRVRCDYTKHSGEDSGKTVTQNFTFGTTPFEGLTFLDVTINNPTSYDLSMDGYQFLFIDADGNPHYAMDGKMFYDMMMQRRLPGLETAYRRIRNSYKETPERRIMNELVDQFGVFFEQASNLNRRGRQILSLTKASSGLAFAVPQNVASRGTFSFRERKNVSASAAKIAETDKLEFRLVYVPKYFRTQLYDYNHRISNWVEIDEATYRANVNSPTPEKYWYNKELQRWMPGDPPED
jgi:hypothetical protein